MIEILKAIASWQSLLFVVGVFGFAPGFTLRLLVKIYPGEDPRRAELVAQLYVLGRLERPLFVAEQLETVLFEGVTLRLSAWRRRREITDDPQRWSDLSGYERHAACIIAARKGDTKALDALVADLSPLVWHVARRGGLSRTVAEDVTQTVWLALLRNLIRLTSPGPSPIG